MNILITIFEDDVVGNTNSTYYMSKDLAKREHTAVVRLKKESLLYQLLEDSNTISVTRTIRCQLTR